MAGGSLSGPGTEGGVLKDTLLKGLPVQGEAAETEIHRRGVI